ncbi:MAG: tetratricopeptide repeat protein, partial [Prevotellaceae bacterium]|jgi:tetratricopeptide (TPR) repeat protein|nr:tetratricopeptide repeat protein [Prevotellaceae bacterium]
MILNLKAQEKYEEIEIYHNLLLNMDTVFVFKDTILTAGYTGALTNIGYSYIKSEKYDKAEDLLKKTSSIINNAPSHYFSKTQVLQAMILLYRFQDKNDKAEEFYMQELDRLKQQSEEFNDILIYHLQFGVTLLYMGDESKYDKAEELIKQSIEISEKLIQEAQEAYEKISAIRQLGASYKLLSQIYNEQEKYDEIINLAPSALKIFDNLSEQDYNYNENILAFLSCLGNSYYYKGKYAEAQNCYIRALKTISFNPSYNSNKAITQVELGKSYYYTNEYEKAIDYLDGDPVLLI